MTSGRPLPEVFLSPQSITPTRVAEFRLAAPGQNGSQKNGGGAHLPHQFLRHGMGTEGRGVHHQRLPFPPGRAAEGLQNTG